MVPILQNVKIYWNDDIDNVLTNVESQERVLNTFFTISDWDCIRAMHSHVIENSCFSFEDKHFSFVSVDSIKMVDIETQAGEIRVHLEDFYSLVQHLFDVMIDGANIDHHSVRYEPWFQKFTENANQLRTFNATVDQDAQEHYVYEAFIAEQGY